ncbi:MAG: transglycosylase domain-containing protein [Gammaproteobacteria bacterium]
MRRFRKTFSSKKGSIRKSKGFGKTFFGFIAVVLLWSLIILGLLVAFYSKDLPDLTEFAAQDRRPQITIRTQDGEVLAKYGDLYGKPLVYSQIPQDLIYAVIATEDQRFFDHFGFDFWGILRAYLVNIRAGKYVQGGSTITQQLSKVAYLSPEKTLKRKILEVIIALQLEQKFTKEQILTLYLNRIYMGKGVYGIDGAARYYFGKRTEDLDLYEAAIIAAMIKAPSKYSPANNFALAVSRAKYVLDRMVDEGYISNEQARRARPPQIIQRGINRGILKNPYFADYVLSELQDKIGEINQDINVFTTLDIALEQTLEAAAIKYRSEMNTAKATQVAGVVMEPNGAIKAMLGGFDYGQSQYNRAVNAYRQPGSSFKLFVYLAALENGVSTGDRYIDEPRSYYQGKGLPLWVPKNFTNKHYGEMTVEHAFAHSINTVAVQVSEQIERTKVIEMAHRLGIDTRIPNLPSIALGSVDVNLLDLTAAYAHIANNGISVVPYAILEVTDGQDKIIYQHPGLELEQKISDGLAGEMKQLLAKVVDSGTGRSASLNYQHAYGKTGTSQDHRDAWFIGFTDRLVTGIWVGNDANTPMDRVSGGNLPAKIWKDFNENYDDFQTSNIPEPIEQPSIFDFVSDEKL